MRRFLIAPLAVLMTVLPVLTSPAMAESVPAAGRYDSRVRNARYVDGQVYRIDTNRLRTTMIEFGPGEYITNILMGDTAGFQEPQPAAGGQAFGIKPVAEGAVTNASVYTNRRAYYFEIRETGHAAYYAVRFDGGVSSKNTGSAASSKMVKRTAPYTSYGANVLNDITPLQVWDDGAFTYFRFPDAGRVPAIFKTQTGPERTVNSTTTADGTVRVSGISQYWVLRAGTTETVVAMMDPTK
ncbi:TrbG/VirB9 family P-type conjugative transfer protein [Martelella alba]|nr:TrbG/VirB9 family P-type conjugative transfer protein [Martelella alba]